MDWLALHRALPWEAFPIGAIVVGAVLVPRGSRRAFGASVLVAILGAVLLGTGPGLVAWLRTGRAPEIEIAGMGGLAGLVGAYALVTRGRRLDAIARATAAMISVSRLGCFVAGCDYGAATSSPLAIAYPPHTPAFLAQRLAGLIAPDATSTLPVHPTQLYEVVVGLVALFAARRIESSRDGDRLAAVLVVYALGRLVVDTMRGDLVRGALGLTPTQLLALGLCALVFAWRYGTCSVPAHGA